MKKYQQYLQELLEKKFHQYGIGAKPRHGAYSGYDGVAKGDEETGYKFDVGGKHFWYTPHDDMISVYERKQPWEEGGDPLKPDKYEIIGDKHIVSVFGTTIEFYPETKTYKVIKV